MYIGHNGFETMKFQNMLFGPSEVWNVVNSNDEDRCTKRELQNAKYIVISSKNHLNKNLSIVPLFKFKILCWILLVVKRGF